MFDKKSNSRKKENIGRARPWPVLILKITEIERQRSNEERRGCAKKGGFDGEIEKSVRERLHRRKKVKKK